MATDQFDYQAAVKRATAYSPFLQRLVEHPPPTFSLSHLATCITSAEIARLLELQPPLNDADLWRTLRQVRQHVFLTVAVQDIAGVARLDDVLTSITALANESVRFALTHLLPAMHAAYGEPIGEDSGQVQHLIVVGMGKLGGEELNVSSDIDLIFLYEEEGHTNGSRSISNHEFFSRLGRKLIAALSELTSDGYVFRVDMRLRPYGESGPLVASLSMLENYFHTQGREWERYAWLKARAVTGDPTGLNLQIAPFVFRRHLDYSAIESLRALHGQIREEVRRKDIATNIKLGDGGIREIEFIAQVFQLIRGGQETDLRTRSTRHALSLLRQKRLLPNDAVVELMAAYEFLRNLEHRLQYAEDQQTQTLPTEEDALLRLALVMDFDNRESFSRALSAHREHVSRHFEGIFAGQRRTANRPAQSSLWEGQLPEQETLTQLATMGYGDPRRIAQRIQSLRQSGLYRRMSATTQSRIDSLGPHILLAAGTQSNPDATFERLLIILESIGRREAYLALLQEYAGARDRLVRLANASPWAAGYLARHPVLLDELVSERWPEAPDWQALERELARTLDQQRHAIDRQMDLLRNFKQVHTFRLLIQDLAEHLPLESLSDHLSDLAATLLSQVLRLCWSHLSDRNGSDPKFAIIGYGKLGGKELGYASDLDLIFLHDAQDPQGPELYTRLAMRMNTWLTTLTGAGTLYDIDLRLRPDGESGMLVSPIDAFEAYQMHKAWVFEHQALTRARFVAGDADIGRRFEALRARILTRARDLEALKGEITAMRQRMLDGHPNKSGRFDIKHDRGGIVDVEFIVQYLVLGFAQRYPELTANVGNLALLKRCGRLRLIPERLAEAVHHSYREFRRLQHALRLQDERYARVDTDSVLELTAPVKELWEQVFESTSVPNQRLG